ncbi:HU family DNA-binding protein [Alteromonas antoniana]|uniref:HU family DNA-binding protein n=1 Tax=Alteromonas antoniana TaxID=2803813 RepID=UPI001C476559|nr:HU family DNA-binding protein [Alteromonas antoniana]
MNKSAFIEKYSRDNNISKKAAGETFDSVMATLKQGLAEDGVLALPDFGNFKVVTTPERQGRNPQTGEPMTIKSGKKVNFKASSVLKNSLV